METKIAGLLPEKTCHGGGDLASGLEPSGGRAPSVQCTYVCTCAHSALTALCSGYVKAVHSGPGGTPVVSLQASYPPSLVFYCLYPIGTRTRDIYIPHMSFQMCFIIFTWHLLSRFGLCRVLVARTGLFSSCGISLSCSPAGLWGTRAPAAALPKPQSTGSTAAAHRPDCSTTPGSGLLPDRRRNPRTRYH